MPFFRGEKHVIAHSLQAYYATNEKRRDTQTYTSVWHLLRAPHFWL